MDDSPPEALADMQKDEMAIQKMAASGEKKADTVGFQETPNY